MRQMTRGRIGVGVLVAAIAVLLGGAKAEAGKLATMAREYQKRFFYIHQYYDSLPKCLCGTEAGAYPSTDFYDREEGLAQKGYPQYAAAVVRAIARKITDYRDITVMDCPLDPLYPHFLDEWVDKTQPPPHLELSDLVDMSFAKDADWEKGCRAVMTNLAKMTQVSYGGITQEVTYTHFRKVEGTGKTPDTENHGQCQQVWCRYDEEASYRKQCDSDSTLDVYSGQAGFGLVEYSFRMLIVPEQVCSPYYDFTLYIYDISGFFHVVSSYEGDGQLWAKHITSIHQDTPEEIASLEYEECGDSWLVEDGESHHVAWPPSDYSCNFTGSYPIRTTGDPTDMCWLVYQGSLLVIDCEFEEPGPGTDCVCQCPNGPCESGNSNTSVGSVHLTIPLGKLSAAKSAGVIELWADEPSADLASPKSLRYAMPGVKPDGVVVSGMSLTRNAETGAATAVTPEVTAVVTPGTGGYTIEIRRGTVPIRQIIVSNPDYNASDPDAECTRLWVLQNKSLEGDWTAVSSALFVYDANTGWTLFRHSVAGVIGTEDPSGLPVLKAENKTVDWYDDDSDGEGDRRVEIVTVSEPGENGDYVVLSREVETYRILPWGEELIEKKIGLSGAERVESWTFYGDDDNVADTDVRYGKLKCHTAPASGAAFVPDVQTVYTYDVDSQTGAITKRTTTVKDRSNAVLRSTEMTYFAVADIGGGLGAGYGTCIVEKDSTGAELSRKYILQTTSQIQNGMGYPAQVSIECATTGAAWTAADNRRTKTTYVQSGEYAGKPETITYPNGKTVAYVYGSTQRVTTTAKSNGSTVAMESQTAYSTSSTMPGHATGSVTKEGGSVIASESYTLDDAGRPIQTLYTDGTTSSTTYGCCGPLTTTDRSGVVTTYVYDSLGRTASTTRGDTKTAYTYDAMGRVTKTEEFYIATNESGTTETKVSEVETEHNMFGEVVKTTTMDGAGVALYVDEYLRNSESQTMTVTRKGPTNQVISTETVTYDNFGREVSRSNGVVTQGRTYDALDRTVNETRGGSVVSTNAYNLLGQLVSVTNVIDEATSKSYTTTYSETIDATANTTTRTTTYPPTVSGGTGDTRIETYDGFDRLVAVSGTAAHPEKTVYGVETVGTVLTRFTKSIKLNIASETEWSQTNTDGFGQTRCVKYSAPSGTPTQTMTYYTAGETATGQLKSRTDPDGVVMLYAYNAKGELVRTAIDMNRDGSINPGTDRVTETVREVVTAHGKVCHRATTSVYDSAGAATVVSQVDASVDGLDTWSTQGGLTTHSAISFGDGGAQTVTVTKPDGTSTVTVSQNGRTTRVTEKATDNTTIIETQYAYDAMGRTSIITESSGKVTTLGYEGNSDLVVSTLVTAGALTQQTTYAYDARGRRTMVDGPDGQAANDDGVVYYDYWPTGELKKTFGARTTAAEYTYDYAGRKKTMTTWKSVTIANGTCTGSTPAVTTWNYDAYRGWLTSKTYDANTAGPSYTYTAAGRLATRTWARGNVTAYTYDNAGQIASIAYRLPDTTTDPDTPGVSYTYDRRGRITQVVDGTGTRTMSYHAATGQPLNEDLWDSSYTGATLAYAYDASGRRTSLICRQELRADINRNGKVTSTDISICRAHLGTNGTYSQGDVTGDGAIDDTDLEIIRSQSAQEESIFSSLSTTHDSAGRIATQTMDSDAVATYSYSPISPVPTGIVHSFDGNTRLTVARTLDGLGRLTSITSTPSDANAGVQSFTYATNDANQRTQSTLADTTQWSYAYDVLGQLTAGKHKADSSTYVVGQQFEYDYDAIGNRTAVRSGGDAAGANLVACDYASNLLNQYTSRNTAAEAFTHDVDGNLIADARWTYTYDAENRLTTMTSQTSVAVADRRKLVFSYDYLGRRTKKLVFGYDTATNTYTTAPISGKTFIYDGWNLLAELNALDASPVRTYANGLDLSGSLQGAGGIGGLAVAYDATASAYVFPAYDGNGNVVGLADGSTGTWAAKYEYSPFGQQLVGAITGTASLSGFTGDASTLHLRAKLVPTSGGDTLVFNNVSLDSTGHFVLSPIPYGTYTVWLKPTHALAAQVTNVSITGFASLGTVNFTNGDCDGNNTINTSDLSTWGYYYTSYNSRGENLPGWQMVDLNGDGEVGFGDYSVFVAAYGSGQTGVGEPVGGIAAESFASCMATIAGTANLVAFVGDYSTLMLRAKLVPIGGGMTVEFDNVALSSTGAFVLSPVPQGTYTIWLKVTHGLATHLANVTVMSSTPLGSVTFFNGDCDESNKVDSDDVDIITAAMGSTPGDAVWDVRADLDGSGEVDSRDSSIASGMMFSGHNEPADVTATDPFPIRFSTKYTDLETRTTTVSTSGSGSGGSGGSSGGGSTTVNVSASLVYFGYRYYNADTARWLTRDPIGESGGVNLYEYCGNEPVGRYDPTGLWMSWEHRSITKWAWTRSDAPEDLKTFFPSVYTQIEDANIATDKGYFYEQLSMHYNRPLDGDIERYRQFYSYDLQKFVKLFDTTLEDDPVPVPDCRLALIHLGTLTHMWEDYYAHAVDLDMPWGVSLVPPFDKAVIIVGVMWWGDPGPIEGSPDAPSMNLKPSSYGWNLGEHGPPEPAWREKDHGMLRNLRAQEFVGRKLGPPMKKWWKKCCCYVTGGLM